VGSFFLSDFGVDSRIAEIFAYYLMTPSPLFELAIAGRDADPLLELALLIL
jgi:hypothetical protein